MFDRNALKLKPLADRVHNLDLSAIRQLKPVQDNIIGDDWRLIARRIIEAKKNGSAVIMMMGGHVFRSGAQNYIIDMLKRGFITHLATNGSGMIHDYEFALIGATTESVAKYIRTGQFGLWQETGFRGEKFYEREYLKNVLSMRLAAFTKEIST